MPIVLTITITNDPGVNPDREQNVRDTFAAMHTIPVHPENHAQKGQPVFTENQWIKESLIKYMAATVHTHQRQEAIGNIEIPLDDSIAT